MRRHLSFFSAVALLIGTQVGAGVLGLPKVLAPLGFFWGPVALFVAAYLLAMTAVMLVEAIYLTNPRYHYFDLASHYLGSFGIILVLTILYAGYAALVAYISGLGQVLSSLAGGDPLFWSFIAWAALSAVVFFGLRLSGPAEESLTVFMILLVVTIFLWALPEMQPYTARFDFPSFAIAMGVAVFGFFSHTLIPEVVQGFRNMNKTIIAIFFSFSIVFVTYTLFSLSIMGAAGSEITEIGTLVLAENLGNDLSIIAILLPLLTITTSFIGMGTAQRDILQEIVKNRLLAWIFAVLPPLVLYILGYGAFVGMIWLASLGMIVACGILPPILLLYARKEKRRSLTPIPDWFAYTTLTFFAVLLVYSVLSTLFGHIKI